MQLPNVNSKVLIYHLVKSFLWNWNRRASGDRSVKPKEILDKDFALFFVWRRAK